MSDPNAIDANALAPWLEAHVAGFSGLRSVTKFSAGQSNPTYRIDAASGAYVLRAKPPGELLKSAHQVDREFRVLQALGPTKVPVPRVFALSGEGDESPIVRMFYVMEFLEGRIFWDASLPEVAREARAPLFHTLTDTLADLHTVDYEKIGLGDFGKPGNYFARQIDRWSKQYKAAETEKLDAMDKLMEWLPTAIPQDDATSIVHGDFRFDNTIIHPTEPRVLAVLDWELSTLGHPLADFTYYLMVWHFPPSVRGGLAGLDISELGIPTLEETAARYSKRTGRDALGHLDFCLAYNMFRLASIAQGVYARALQGNASSDQGIKMGAQIRPLAELAWSYARKAGA